LIVTVGVAEEEAPDPVAELVAVAVAVAVTDKPVPLGPTALAVAE